MQGGLGSSAHPPAVPGAGKQNKISFQETHIVQHHPTERGGIEKFCSLGRESPTRTMLVAAAASLLRHRASLPSQLPPQSSSFGFKTSLFCTKGRGRVSAAGVRGFGDKAGDTSKLVSTNMRISNLLLFKNKIRDFNTIAGLERKINITELGKGRE